MPRQRLEISGVVQGVGFRPYIYQLASANGLFGWVRNVGAGVCLEVQGDTYSLNSFRQQLLVNLPPLARIELLCELEIPERVEASFRVLPSEARCLATSPIPPDIAICNDCRRELGDPFDRRFRYPFINCTNCGPRFTIVDSLPYDRHRTSMDSFAMCEACQSEYEDPTNRRHHAQPNACPICGPQIWWHVVDCDSQDEISKQGSFAKRGEQALVEFRNAIGNGKIVAVKGIGGFHLACDATNRDTIEALRHRKGRFARPFALLMPSLAACDEVVLLSTTERDLLESTARPIVLARKRTVTNQRYRIADNVAPTNDRLGVMLPYSPLHQLLVASDVPLVMTSGNISDEPIAFDNCDAVTRMSQLADAFLLHDRPIRCSCDDSVVQVAGATTMLMRRSRGYAPLPIDVLNSTATGTQSSSVLAIGAELKNTFCFWRLPYAYMSQHIGDMENMATLDSLQQNIRRFSELFRARWDAVAVDLHPGYHATRFGRGLASELKIPCFSVQHHHAHLASLGVEHGLAAEECLLGFCLDGAGYGTDRNIWGGELIQMRGADFQRLAHLEYVRLPNGDANMRKPYRMALSYLSQMNLPWDERLEPVRFGRPEELRILEQQVQKNFHCVSTSSMGRLFDVVASLIGVCQVANYEGQAAIELESLAWRTVSERGPSIDSKDYLPMGTEYRFHWSMSDRRGMDAPNSDGAWERGAVEPSLTIGIQELLEAICQDIFHGLASEWIAFKFHRAIADLIGRLGKSHCEMLGTKRIGLTGGVFQNGLLLQLAVQALTEAGLEVLTHHQVPANDGGLALGQAWIGSLMLGKYHSDGVA